MAETELFLSNFITNQKRAVRYHLIFAIGILGLGISIIIATLLISSETIAESLKSIIGVGGGFISSISSFPIKEIINRKGRINLLNTLKLQLQSADKDERERVEELIWKAIEKTVLE